MRSCVLLDRFGWRMAVRRAGLSRRPGVGSQWHAGRSTRRCRLDPDLCSALEHHGIHVQEELVLSDLIADLGPHG